MLQCAEDLVRAAQRSQSEADMRGMVDVAESGCGLDFMLYTRDAFFGVFLRTL